MSNLPPGVTTSMIPGNRPEDLAWERLAEEFGEFLDEHEIGVYDDDSEHRLEAFENALHEALLMVSEFYRDPMEVAIRKQPCAVCREPLGAKYRQESVQHDEWEEEVYLHESCSLEEGKE